MTITNLFRVWIGLLFKLSVVSLCASWPLLGFGNIVTSISTDCISCDGNATVTTTITGSVLYEWYDNQGNILLVDNNASGSSFVSGLCPGVYFVQFTNGFDNDTQWFSINTSTISAGQPVESVICTNTGTVSLSSLITSETPGGQWYAPNGNPIAANLNSNNAVDGFYTYEVTDGSCTVTGGVLIDAVQNANPGLSTTYLICENYSPFQLITVMAGTPDAGGFWEDAAGNPVSGWYDPAIDVTGIFSYHVNTVAICPAAVSTLYVIENQLPDPGIDNTITVCPSGWPFEMIGALSGTPEIGGYWLDNQGDPVSSQFDPLTMNEGNYTYVLQGATPCPNAQATLTVNFSTGINAGADGTLQLCSIDAPVSLFSGIVGTYDLGGIWTNSAGTVVSDMFDPAIDAPGTFRYTVEGVGCQPVFSEVIVAVENMPFAGSDVNLNLCPTAPVVLLDNFLAADADGGGDWLINSSPSSSTVPVVPGTTVDAVYEISSLVCPPTTANYSISFDIPANAGPDQSLQVCADENTIDLTAMNGVTGVWTDMAGNQFDGLYLTSWGSGQAELLVNSGNSCPSDVAIFSIDIQVPEQTPQLITEVICTNDVELNLQSVTGWPAGGQWSLNGNNIEAIVATAPQNNQVYQYSFDNGGFCGVVVSELTLSIGIGLSAGEDATLSVCASSESLDLTNYLVNADPGGQWSLNGENTSSNQVFLNEGTFSFVYMVNPENFCPADIAFVQVEVHPVPTLENLPELSVCQGEELVISTLSEPGVSYAWTPAFLFSNANNSTTDVITDMPVIEEVILFATNGFCDNQEQVSLTINPLPNVQLEGPSTICENETALLVASGAASYAWFENGLDSGLQGSMISSVVDETANYTVIGTSAEGCEGEAEWTVEMLEAPSSNFNVPTEEDCPPVMLNLYHDNPSGPSYAWLLNGEEVSIFPVMLSTPGTYEVTLVAVDEFGCSSQTTMEAAAQVFPMPTAMFSTDQSVVNMLNPVVQFNNESVGADLFFWQFSGNGISTLESPSFEFPAEAERGYEVCLEVVNEQGCADTFCSDVYVEGDWFVYVPSAFSPDKDGLNEVFQPVVTGINEDEYLFQVFNRWGIKVFETTDPEGFWDGSVENGDYYTQVDVYIWVVEAKDVYTADKHRFEGQVTVLR